MGLDVRSQPIFSVYANTASADARDDIITGLHMNTHGDDKRRMNRNIMISTSRDIQKGSVQIGLQGQAHLQGEEISCQNRSLADLR